MQDFFKKFYKFFFKLFLASFSNKRYIHQPAVFESITPTDTTQLFIFVIAFNDVELINLQNRFLRKHLRDTYKYFVADNSNKEDRAKEIMTYCIENGISYVRLPKNPGMDGSQSHGFALNWIYENIIKKFKPRAFVFMDADLMLVEDLSINTYLNLYDSWGVISYHRSFHRFWQPYFAWWAGFACFNFAPLEKRKPNFLPAWGLDTGGRIKINRSQDFALRFSEIYGHPRVPTFEIAPFVGIYMCGKFAHFVGGGSEAASLIEQKRWAEKLLEK